MKINVQNQFSSPSNEVQRNFLSNSMQNFSTFEEEKRERPRRMDILSDAH